MNLYGRGGGGLVLGLVLRVFFSGTRERNSWIPYAYY
jgi:hypothetical protein